MFFYTNDVVIRRMKIVMITSEAVPYSKSGGLADVAGALPAALNSLNQDVRIVLPSYNCPLSESGDVVCSFKVPMLSEEYDVTVTQKIHNGVIYNFICHPVFNDRRGIYGDTSFLPYPDNFKRYTLLCKAALIFCENIGFKPDIMHCHDWTTGLLPYFIKTCNSKFYMDTKTVFTIHNLAYQGNFPYLDFLQADITPNENLFEFKQVNMIKSGLIFSDYITTVSPTYAKEIQSEEQGCNMERILQRRRDSLKGIVNGIDIQEWNPESDPLISTHFSKYDFTGKSKLKEEIQKTFNLPQRSDVPLFAMISRLASQKGFDVLIPVLEKILKSHDLQFIIIGTGDSILEQKLLELSSVNDNLSVNIMFSNKYAHLVEAGSDFFLMPSRYEPCGLNQLYSLRYGTIPIAHRTGGLADTIADISEHPDDGTGILFDVLSPDEIYNSVEKAVDAYGKDDFNDLRFRAMSQDFSWNSSAKQYLDVYKSLLQN